MERWYAERYYGERRFRTPVFDTYEDLCEYLGEDKDKYSIYCDD